MEKDLRCKKCGEPLVIIKSQTPEGFWTKNIQQLYCPVCCKAAVEVRIND